MASIRIPFTPEQKKANAAVSARIAVRKAALDRFNAIGKAATPADEAAARTALQPGDLDEARLSVAVSDLNRQRHVAKAKGQKVLMEALTAEIHRHGWDVQDFAKNGVLLSLRDMSVAQLDPELLATLRKMPLPSGDPVGIQPLKRPPTAAK